MEKLLQWSIAQQSGDQEAIAKIGNPDPELLQQLFGNAQVQDDPTLMKQNLFIIEADELDLENKIIACENFEMLIENLDNAMNIENMKMWEKLINLIDPKSLKEEKLIFYILSIIGTALQNNEKSQQDFMTYTNGLGSLIYHAKRTTDNSDEKVKLKALYALSSLLRHNEKLLQLFNAEESNYDLILDLLENSNSDKLRLRTLSLLSLILSTGFNGSSNEYKLKVISQHKLVNELISLLDTTGDDSIASNNLKDKVLNILLNDLIQQNYKFSDEEKTHLNDVFKKLDADQFNEDDYKLIKQVL